MVFIEVDMNRVEIEGCVIKIYRSEPGHFWHNFLTEVLDDNGHESAKACEQVLYKFNAWADWMVVEESESESYNQITFRSIEDLNWFILRYS